MDESVEMVDDEAERTFLLQMTHISYEVAMLGEIGNKYSQTYLNKAPYRIPQQTGYEWVMENLDNRKMCYKMFRMYPDVFISLHDLLVDDYGLQSSRGMTSLESLAMFLWMVGAPQSFSQVENRFARSTETIHRKFKEVLDCLCKLSSNNIKPNDYSFSTPHERIKDDRFWPHFEGAIGAIDGCHIPVSVPALDVITHTGRHGFTSQNVMAVCDFDMRFTFVVVGWPGSAHDTRILNHTVEKYAHKFPLPPHGTTKQYSYSKQFSFKFSFCNANFVVIFRQILPCRFRLSKPKWIPCSIQRPNLSYTGVSQ